MSLLADIFARKRRALSQRPRPLSPAQGERRSFADALRTQDRLSAIAEVKRKSPSGGAFPHADLVEVAKAYERAGAAAISVLTDDVDFGGSVEDLLDIRRAVQLPLLRKDFLVAPEEVVESRGLGADAILLIADALEDGLLQEMLAAAQSASLDALVEAHDLHHAERALKAGARLVGINNRNLANLKTDTETALRLMPSLRSRADVLVAESGLRSADDFRRARAAGADAVLVGESLLRDTSPGLALQRLLEECHRP